MLLYHAVKTETVLQGTHSTAAYRKDFLQVTDARFRIHTSNPACGSLSNPSFNGTTCHIALVAFLKTSAFPFIAFY